MLTITKREKVGSIQDKVIYRVGAFQILPLPHNMNKLNEEKVNKIRRTLGLTSIIYSVHDREPKSRNTSVC